MEESSTGVPSALCQGVKIHPRGKCYSEEPSRGNCEQSFNNQVEHCFIEKFGTFVIYF